MNKEELIGKLQMVYVGNRNVLNELIGYYDGLKQGIEELQQENQELKKMVELYTKSLYNAELTKYKEVIDKIDKYINYYNVFEVFSFPLMKRWEEEQVKSCIDYEFKTSLIKDLKDILKEVE